MDDQQPEDSPGEPNPNREAAKYRRQLRDTEQQRDTLTATLTALQRGRVESIAASHGVTPTAFWAAGTELADLLGDDGEPDTDKIAAAVQHCCDVLGITPKQAGLSGLHSGAMLRPPPTDHWRDAFAPKQ